MRSIVIHSRVGKGGALRVDVPAELAGTEVEVTVVPRPINAGPSAKPGELGWSPGFFEDIVGGWQGDALIRDPQGEYETRRTP